MLKKKIKIHRIEMTEEQKKAAILALKIVAICFFAACYSLLWIQGLYKGEDGGVHWKRILIPTILFLIPSAALFIKVKIPDKANIVISVLFSIAVMRENYIMLAVSQGYQWKNLPVLLEDMNMLIIFMIFIVFFAIFNSFKAGIIGLNIVTVVFGLSNYFLVIFRGTGILAVDVLELETAANVAGGYTYTLDFYTYMLLISSLAICFLTVKLGRNTWTPKFWRIVPIVVAICVVSHCYDMFIETDEFDKLLKIKYFKPQETFDTNGMYVTFAKSIKDLIVQPPEGYSVKTVEKISEENQQTKAEISEEKTPNIIMIMDEAYTDFESITDLKLNKDCLPFIHSLDENTITGQMFVSIFGGGTASTEFEALTSNTMAFVPNGITAYTTYINSPMPSLANVLQSQNYGGLLAMHPYKGNGYKRNKVYPLLGFDKFITIDDFTETKYIRNYVSDEGDFDRIISEYENYKKNNKSPFFLFNVTMQAHSPFDKDFDNLPKDIKTEYDTAFPQADRYMNLLKCTDDAFQRLVNYFENVDEPTMIVFFGDHQPRIEDKFYAEVKKGYKLDEVYKEIYKYCTQFIIWANYDIEEQKDVYTSANYLSSLILDTAGLKKSGYQELTSKIRKDVPIITKHGYIGKNGKFYELDDTKSPYYKILQEYNQAQYNNIFDTKNRVDSLFEIK